ncbi:helix-turn-helix domain-containing protein [Streptomyces sp. NBC_01764]|uniref:helix-turn-helix domain-containing protein n=1 Tax=Streptomyces sp. NBC_01764 TaxID=2975935 RepID=UPI0022565C47|nr:helix-turn-helix transcriptional regulator [Streptomyces sp. NBC_01764]MCX4411040.1 helix-turn-helix domain-containing protein [Streptomyces sp. NBC_01764]
MDGDEFEGLLRELKERSGLSYGVLAKRLHVSTSTLHRYVNGDAVPTDYAPVERLARVCGATPEELVELHRRWVRADALRGQKGAPPAAPTAPEAPEVASGAEGLASELVGEPSVGPSGEASAGGRRRRTVLFASVAVAAVLASAALAVRFVPDGNGGRDGGRKEVGAAASAGPREDARGTASPDDKHRKPSASVSTSASASATRGGGPEASVSAAASGGSAGRAVADGATAPVVATNPYKWEGPCSQHYLVNRKAAQVPPPPNESDARGWVRALGGVAGQEQMLALTVQGTGKATVVLDGLHVRVVGKDAPLAWNDYAMGVGCGGGVETKSFAVDLDAGRPVTTPKGGQRDFPYKVSESDPEVFYVFADARAHDVSWYLELDWSSGARSGTVRIDDNGKPFRTSGNVGRPAYDYPLGGSEWQTAATG